MPKMFTDKMIFNSLANLGLNAINVTSLGQVNQMLSAAGITGGVPNYGSQADVGLRAWFTAQDFLTNSRYMNTTNGTLFGGLYQLVKVDSAATAGNVAVGKVAYIKNTTAGNQAFTVTSEDIASSNSEVAGVFVNTITPGNLGAIVIAGKGNVLLKTGLSNGGPAEGDALFAGGGAGTVDDLALGVAFSTLQLNKYLGFALAVPVSATTIAMQIKGILGIY